MQTGSSSPPFDEGPDQREWLAVAGIWAGAFVLRLLHLLEIRGNDPFYWRPAVDPLFYHQWAAEIAEGDWLGSGVFLQGPLYPYLLSLLYSVTGPNLFWPRFINALVGSLVCVLVWWIARPLFGRRTAVVASALSASYGMFIFYEGSLLIANLAIPLSLLVVAAAVRAMDTASTWPWLLLGVAIGASALGRPNMLLYGPLVIVALFWFGPASGDVVRRGTLAVCLVAGLGLAIAPSALRNYFVADDPVLVSASAGMNFYNGNNPDANGTHNVPGLFDRSMADHPAEQNTIYRRYAENQLGRSLRASEVSDYWLAKGLDWVAENPLAWVQLVALKFLYFVNGGEIWNNRSYEVTSQFSWVLRLPLVRFGFVAPLGVLGLVLTAGSFRKLFPLYALIGVTLATSLIFFVLSRYRVPMVPVLIMFAAAALVWLYDAARARRREFVPAIVALALFAGVSNVELGTQDLSVAYYNLGNRYRLSNDHQEAIEQYRKSLAINGNYISAHNNLAISLERSGRHREEAIEAWRSLGEMGRRRGLEKYVERAERHLRALEGS
ncbi:MAG: tetratricopeptide repeat protein [bacterium]|nr:tetratricopeptide repeat protein [bacterium]